MIDYKNIPVFSPDIWRNMARLCVKSKRIDVAGLCFARMNSPASARALKLCEGQELDSKVAMLALQLDMLVSTNRYSLGLGLLLNLHRILISGRI
jgi:hypothetical protein